MKLERELELTVLRVLNLCAGFQMSRGTLLSNVRMESDPVPKDSTIDGTLRRLEQAGEVEVFPNEDTGPAYEIAREGIARLKRAKVID